MNKYKKIIYENMVPLLGKIFKQKKLIRCIYYHNIVSDRKGDSFQDVELNKFKEQMLYLRNSGYETLLFKEIEEVQQQNDNCKKHILITFDDGFRSNYELVFPLMKKLELKFCIFLRIDKIDNDDDYLTWDMIKEMHGSGLVSFGAHTYSHISSIEINPNNYKREVLSVNRAIQENTGEPVEDFCFPYGYYNDEIIHFLLSKKAYKRLFTSDYRDKQLNEDSWKLGRYGISNNDGIKVFTNKIKGNYDIMYLNLVKLHKKG